MRIVVVGGGIGGLAAAIALSRVGVEVELYEQAVEFREVGAGITLATNALRALGVLGLAGDIQSQGVRALQGGLRVPDGDALVSLAAGGDSNQMGEVAVVHRADLLALLARHVEPERLHLGRKCVGIDQEAGGIAARFHTGETVRADGVVGADGLRSTVRAQMPGKAAVRYAGYTAWRAVVNFVHGESLTISETWGRGCRFGIVPMAGDRVYWFATRNGPPGRRGPAVESREVLARWFGGWHEPIGALIGAATEDTVLQNDIYELDPLPPFVQGRVALLGDAAHAMTPNLGQGACQAIEDGVVLAACLKMAGRVELGLHEYERRRLPRTRQVQRWSRWIGVAGQLENPVLCRLRDFAMRMSAKRASPEQMQALLGAKILTAAEEALFAPRRS